MTHQVPFLNLSGATAAVRQEVQQGWEQILDRNGFIGGEPVTNFETAFADYCETSYAVGVGNGTDALHLALRALGVGPGDEVILPANTFVATVEAVVLAGATPVFTDADPETLLITPELIEAAVTERSRAVMPVHLYGQCVDMDGVMEVARRHDLLVVEDAAQAQGAKWAGRSAGSTGHAGCFSFYPGKNLGAFGDAGAVVTSDEAVYRDLLSRRDHGRGPGGHYDHPLLGTNSRLDALQAVVLRAKLAHLDSWNQARRDAMALYRELVDVPEVTWVREQEKAEPIYHLAVVRVDERDKVRERLARDGVATGIHYPMPCHLMAPYRQYSPGTLPVVEQETQRLISLPMYPDLSRADIEHVSASLLAAVRGE